MKPSLQEVEDLVRRLNLSCAEQTQSCTMVLQPFQLISNGNEIMIRFMEQPIWDSENDERKQYDTGEFEQTLEEFVRCEAQKFLDAIRKVNVV